MKTLSTSGPATRRPLGSGWLRSTVPMLWRSAQTSQRIAPAWPSIALFARYVAEKLVADGVVRGEGRAVRRGGLGAAVSTVGFEHHDRLLLGNALHAADKLGSVVEAFHVGPDLLHGGILLVVVDAVLLVHIARVAERNEARDPGLLRRAGQLG